MPPCKKYQTNVSTQIRNKRGWKIDARSAAVKFAKEMPGRKGERCHTLMPFRRGVGSSNEQSIWFHVCRKVVSWTVAYMRDWSWLHHSTVIGRYLLCFSKNSRENVTVTCGFPKTVLMINNGCYGGASNCDCFRCCQRFYNWSRTSGNSPCW